MIRSNWGRELEARERSCLYCYQVTRTIRPHCDDAKCIKTHANKIASDARKKARLEQKPGICYTCKYRLKPEEVKRRARICAACRIEKLFRSSQETVRKRVEREARKQANKAAIKISEARALRRLRDEELAQEAMLLQPGAAPKIIHRESEEV